MLAMAMALMVRARLLLLDEPSAGLSPLAAETLFETIRRSTATASRSRMVEQNASDALAISTAPTSWSTAATAATGDARRLAADPEIRKLFLGG